MVVHTVPGATGDELLYDLDDAQRRAVTSPARPLAILAPAGSGKTRVLTRRIAWRIATEDAEASHVLALTFTRKAAGELRDRLRRLGLRDGVAAGTFHGIAYAQLRAHWADRGRRPPDLLTRKAKLLADVLRGPGRPGELTPATLATEIEWAKARLLGPGDYAEGAAAARRRPPAPPDRIAALYARYEEAKREHHLVDFDDLLKLCGDALLGDAAFAAAQRWRFRHLFVDEFQDVNPLQLRLLDAWRGNHLDLTVVGDPQQAIYGWNGADAGFLERFAERYPTAEVISLARNYRSTPQILGAAASVLRAARLDARPVHATQVEGPAPRLTRYATDLDEARGVARAVRDHRAPQQAWSDQAVLVRTHAQVGLIAEGLRAVGIPYVVKGGDALLKKPATRSALDLLRGNHRPLAACLPDLEALRDELPSMGAGIAGAGDGVSVGPGVGDDGGDDGARLPDPHADIVQLARDHLRLDPGATAAGFGAWLVATLQAEGGETTPDAVTIATFHAAKGLEWPVVHLAGLEDGFVPITHARTAAARAEEARLLYVAMTRAVQVLHCSWAAQRTFSGKVIDRRVCPWVKDLEDGSAAVAAPAKPDWRARLAEQREQLARIAAQRKPVDPVLDALVEWREEAARAARVRPDTVIDDDLLATIARRRPRTPDELAAIPGVGRILATGRVGEGLLAALAALPDEAAANARSA
ncbi:MAG TPA: ATP-dependent DNA helicase UvrD2 [Acidimicrobiales bacterium]